MSYIGNEPIVSATRTITEIVATAGQTVFVANGGYTVGFIDVFVNGAQLQTNDFTASNGSSITLNSGATIGDDIRLVAWGTFSVTSVGVSALSATGTPSSTTYLRGDNTWATVVGGTVIPSGTAMLFAQTSAPTGFTKSTTHDNKALRVVSGTASSGGSVAFTTAFASQTPAGSVSVSVGAGTLAVGIGTLSAAATTLSTAQMPSHSHILTFAGDPCGGPYPNPYYVGSSVNNKTTSSTGGGGSHSHSISGSPSLSGAPSVTSATFSGSAINMAVQYVDVIIATKD